MLQDDVKKKLLKTMPHVPLLKLRPELQEQEVVSDDPDDSQTEQERTNIHEENAGEIQANTTFHDMEAECPGANYGLLQRVKRFTKGIFYRRRRATAEDNNLCYGDDESSESDSEIVQDGIPLVRRNKRN